MLEMLIGLIRTLMQACALTWEKPPMFGAFQCAMTACMIISAAACAYMVRRRTEEEKLRILHRLGIVLAVSEVWKQLFCWFIVNHETFSWWYFPFQLCSMPMYLTLALPYVKNRGGILRFLGGYGLLAAVLAMLFPEDMLRVWPVFTMHGFLWHGIMVLMALTARTMKEAQETSDLSAVKLFVMLAFLAEVINVTAAVTAGGSTLPDMFYISPYTTSYQPVFRDIAKALGRVPQILIYMTVLSIAACVVWKVKGRGHADS